MTIGKICGILEEKDISSILVNACGVGYEIYIGQSSFHRLPNVGQEIIIYTHLSVKEDSHTLFGFAERSDRELFRELIKVNGIGPKLAMTILSNLTSADFIKCVLGSDAQRLSSVPGIGKKTASKIILDMKDKLSKIKTIDIKNIASARQNSLVIDAIDALIALGYRHDVASNIVQKIKTENLTSEQIVKEALKSAQ